MQEIIKEYVLNCAICQKAKIQTKVPGGFLQLLLIPSQIWKLFVWISSLHYPLFKATLLSWW